MVVQTLKSNCHLFIKEYAYGQFVNQSNCDIFFVCSNGEVGAHTIFLAKGFFLTGLLLSTNTYDGVKVIMLPDIKKQEMHSFLELMYCGFTKEVQYKDFIINFINVLKLSDILSIEYAKENQVIIHLHASEFRQPKPARKKRTLMRHLKPEDLTCAQCGKEFKKLYKLRIHQLIHSKTPPFVCSICGRGYNNKYKMNQHEKTHKEGSEDLSKLLTKIRNREEQKQQKNEDDEFLCRMCEAPFENKTSLKEHITQSHPYYKKFLCSKCGKVFRVQRGLDHHLKYVCDREESKFECEICGRKLKSPKELQEHRTTHEDSYVKCDICFNSFKSYKSLNHHVKLVHELPQYGTSIEHNFSLNETRLQCMGCGKRFLKQANLESHINRFHTAIKQYACMYCPKRCATKPDLDSHLKSHRGEALHRCRMCNASFVHGTTYRRHVRSHLGQKPYICRPCGRSFSLLITLKKHQRSHERKGDLTQLITAAKGQGKVSYIDHAPTMAVAMKLEEEAILPTLPEVGPVESRQLYIPGPTSYIPSSYHITPLNQMPVIDDYEEITSYNYVSESASSQMNFDSGHTRREQSDTVLQERQNSMFCDTPQLVEETDINDANNDGLNLNLVSQTEENPIDYLGL